MTEITYKISSQRVGRRTFYSYRVYRDGVNVADAHFTCLVVLHAGA